MSSKLSLKKTSLTTAMKHSGRLVVLRAEDTSNHRLNPKSQVCLAGWSYLHRNRKRGVCPQTVAAPYTQPPPPTRRCTALFKSWWAEPIKSLQCMILIQLQSPFDVIIDHNENTRLGLAEWSSRKWENRSHSAGAQQSTRQPGLVALGVSHLSLWASGVIT